MPVSDLRRWRRDREGAWPQLPRWHAIAAVLGALTLALSVAACTRTVTHERASSGYIGYDTDGANPNGITAGGSTFSEEPPNSGPPNYEGSQEAKVSFNGNGGTAKAYKGIDVNVPGEYDGFYGAAFYFPKGTFTGAGLQNGDVEIMGWTNGANDFSGIRLSGTDHLARLVKRTSAGSPQTLGNPVPLREGCWNWVTVHQKLSASQPQNDIWVNGRRMSQSTQANTFATPGATQVRYGLTSTTSQQTNNFHFYIDEAYVSNSEILSPRAAACEPPPNVVFIITDDQRAEGTVVPTVMDQTLARFRDNGTYFPNAVATTPLCCPSRSSILSGRYAHNHLVRTNPEAGNLDQAATVPRYLRDVGYRTALFGKFLNAWPIYRTPPNFDEYGAFVTGSYGNQDPSDPMASPALRVNEQGTVTARKEYSTDYVKRKAIEFVDAQEANDQQPWFMHLSVAAPHLPWLPAARHNNRPFPPFSASPAFNERTGAANDLADKPQWVRDLQAADQTAFNDDMQATRINQLRSLMAVDELVGELFADLDARGETQDTLAIFMSDNGYMWGEHGLTAKTMPYTDSIYVPFYARWPRSSAFPAGQQDTDFVGNVDMAPTVLDSVGIAPNPVMDGISLLDPALHRSKILTEYWNHPPGAWASLVSATTQYTEYYESNGAVLKPVPNGREYYKNMDTAPGKWQLTNILNDSDNSNDPTPSELQALHDDLAKQRLCSGINCSPGSGSPSTVDTVKPRIDVVTPRAGGHVNGVVPIAVNARDNFGVTRVDFRVRQGATVVATMTASAAPFSSSWNSTPGNYTIEATAYDAHGNPSDPATVLVTVDGFDVQTTNPNSQPDGNPANGDSLIYSFPQPIDPASLKAGWGGTGTTMVTVELGGDAGPDPFFNDSIRITGTGVPGNALGEIDLGGANYANFQPSVRAYTQSQMSLSNGGRTVTVVLAGGPTGLGQISPAATNMTWRTGTATSGGVNPCAPSCYVTESGYPYDKEF